MSEPTVIFWTAFLKAQKGMGGAKKTSSNPAFKSKYADLNAVFEACESALHEAGISILQWPECISSEDGKLLDVAITTMLAHESGECFQPPPLRLPVLKIDAQGVGSAITYGRRYHLSAIVGVCPEDDDGNAASKGKRSTSVASDVAADVNVDPKRVDEIVSTITDCLLDGQDIALAKVIRGLTNDEKLAVWPLLTSQDRRHIKALLGDHKE